MTTSDHSGQREAPAGAIAGRVMAGSSSEPTESPNDSTGAMNRYPRRGSVST